MERTRVIEYEGRSIVLLDYTDITDTDEALREIARSKEFFANRTPDGSLLTLTHTTGARYDTEVINALKDLAAHNRPYVKAAAIVTDSALHRVAARTVAMFSKRNLKIFDTPRPAKDWLVEQAEAGD